MTIVEQLDGIVRTSHWLSSYNSQDNRPDGQVDDQEGLEVEDELSDMRDASNAYTLPTLDQRRQLDSVKSELDTLIHSNSNLHFFRSKLEHDLSNCRQFDSLYERIQFSPGMQEAALANCDPYRAMTAGGDVSDDPFIRDMNVELAARRKRVDELNARLTEVERVRNENLLQARMASKQDTFLDGLISAVDREFPPLSTAVVSADTVMEDVVAE